MYVESKAGPCFEDPNNNNDSLPEIIVAGDPHVVFSQPLPTTNNNIDTNNNSNMSAMSIEGGLMVQDNIEHALMMQQQGGGSNNWDSNRLLDLQDLTFNHENPQNPNETQQDFNNNNINSIIQPTPDLLNLNLFHNLPKPNNSNSSSSSSNNNNNICLPFMNPNQMTDLYGTVGLFGDNNINPSSAASVLYDPLFHLNHNLPTQTPLFRDLFQSYKPSSLFDTYNVHNGGDNNENNNNNNIVVGVDNGELGNEGGPMYVQDGDGVVDGGQFENTVFEFGRNVGSCLGKRKTRVGKATKHFTTERERRSQLNDKFIALRSLIPSPSKNDRASVVGDAIEYIKELIRTVKELKSLVKKKRCGKERSKMLKIEEDGANGAVDGESTITRPVDDADSYNGSMRTSWLQRKSKVTEVDVRIIDDEVTIKVVQRKKINCLLHVSRVLNELQLDLHHVAGGHIGEHYSFLFNSKIYEGSTVYASAIASKLIEAVDREYAVAPTASSY